MYLRKINPLFSFKHTRTIGEREYQVREVRFDGAIHKIDEETELSEEEVSVTYAFWKGGENFQVN